jgi:tetratricopeptide (TPR) repeat protein
MSRNYLSLILAAAFLLASAIVGCAQTGELRGVVKLKQADGTTAVVPGAVIDVYRTDVSGKYNTKTDKRGTYVFAGLPYSGTYTVAASAPGAQPNFQTNVKVGRDIVFEMLLEPGDGRRLTLEEINKLGKGAAASGESSAPAKESAADAAKRAEVVAKNKEITEHNKKVDEANATVSRTFKTGNEALIAASDFTKAQKRDEAIVKYTEAIAQYDEGLAADAEQPGILANKAMALKARGVDRYNLGITSKDPATKTAKLEEAKSDFKAAGEVAQKALELLKAEAGSSASDPTAQARITNSKLSALSTRADAMRLFVTKADPTQVDAGAAAFEEYLAAETDPAKKAKAERDMARMLFDANAYEKAKLAYDKILVTSPDDPDTLQNLGLILYNLGFVKEAEGKKDQAKANYQEAANYLQRFVEKSPDGQLKSEAQAVLQNLKEQQNVQAEKASTPTRKRSRP